MAATRPKINRVVLYKHGIASFERKVKVEDSSEIELFFRHSEMNDVLKSLTVVDNNGGTISSVSYDNSEPKEKRLKELSLHVNGNQDHLDLFSQLSGAEVEIDLFDEGTTLKGIIIKTSQYHSNNEMKQFICLKQGQILMVDFSRIKQLSLLDEKLNRELNEALVLGRTNVNKEEKKLSIFTQGQGQREVAISYTIEAPIWKISYRVVLPEGDADDKQDCLLQGWAIIDNITDEKWDNVSLTLIAGEPHSYECDLFKPKYKKRRAEEPDSPPPPVQARYAQQSPSFSHLSNRLNVNMNAMNVQQAFPMQQMVQQQMVSNTAYLGGDVEVNQPSVKVQTDTKEIGDLFQYNISNPVTVNSNQSALVPIVHQKVSGYRCALFNSEKHSTHPNSAVFMINNTDLTLESGPCTVLEGGTFVGESNFEICKPRQSKFIEFATEQSMDIWTKQSTKTIPHKCRLSNGTLTIDQFHQTITTYHIRSKSGKQTYVFIEHRFNKSCKLVDTPEPTNPKPINFYIFKVTSPGTDTILFPVTEQRKDSRAININKDLTYHQLNGYILSNYLTEPAVKNLKVYLELIEKTRTINSQIMTIDKTTKDIHDNHNRIRSNLNVLQHTGDEKVLRNRYITELTQDEEQLKKLAETKTGLQTTVDSILKDANAILQGISCEVDITPK